MWPSAKQRRAACPCAEAYLSLAEQNGATAQEIDHTLRRLFARAGVLAGVGLAASRVHVGGRLPAAIESKKAHDHLPGWQC